MSAFIIPTEASIITTFVMIVSKAVSFREPTH